MALRTIRIMGDEVLTKTCREVTKVTPRISNLIDDMLETMYDACGVGLAAPQVGVLRRIVVIDVGEGPIVMINPVILETAGSQTGDEGCLSLPGKAGQVTRPNYVKQELLMRIWKNMRLKGKVCWHGPSAMNWIILMVICMWKKWKVRSTMYSMRIRKTRKTGKKSTKKHSYVSGS